jgi:hypothetical protein
MARPIKEGLDYSPQDTDIHSDREIRRLISEFKAEGYLIFDYIKAQCFREKGYWIQFDDNFCFDVSDVLKAGITQEVVLATIMGCIRIGLFDKNVFEKHKIITSADIQDRYIKAKRNPVIDAKIWVIDAKINVNTAITPITTAKSTQRKEEKRKEEKRKDNDDVVMQSPIDGFRSLESQKDRILQDQNFIAQISQLGIKVEIVPNWFDAFNRFLTFRGQTLKQEQDYRVHFSRWLPKIPNYRTLNPDGYMPVTQPEEVPQTGRKVILEYFMGGEVEWTEEEYQQYCKNPAASGYTFVRYAD